MSVGRILGTLNGVVIGTVFGLAIYLKLIEDPITIETLLAGKEIAGITFSAASAAAIMTGFKPIPGVIGGIAGGVLAVPLVFLFPHGVGIPASIVGGLIGGLAVSRLPGLR